MKPSEVLRVSGLLILFLSMILFMFIFQFAVEKVNEKLVNRPDAVTGKVIRLIGPDENQEKQVVEKQPAKRSEKQPSQARGEQQKVARQNVQQEGTKLQCLREKGVHENDVRIFGNFLESVMCKKSEKKEKFMKVEVRGECLYLNIEQEAFTLLCDATPNPSLKVEIPSPASKPPSAKPKRGHSSLILFLLFALCSVFAWGRIEVKYKRAEEQEDFKRSFQWVEGMEVRYIKPAPAYSGEEPLSAEEEEKVHAKLFASFSKEYPLLVQKEKLTQEELGHAIVQFNFLAREAYLALQQHHMERAKEIYKKIFPLYVQMYASTEKFQRKDPQSVVKYLFDQVNILAKTSKIRSLIEAAYKSGDQHKVKGTSASEDAATLRTLIEKQQAKEVKQMLGAEKQKDYKGDILDEIDKIHARVKEKSRQMPEQKVVSELEKELKTLREMIAQETSKKRKSKSLQ